MSTLKMRERCRKPGLKYYRTHLDRSWLGSCSTFKTLWTRTTPGEVTDDTRRASGVKCCLLIGLHLDWARLPIGCRAFATKPEERRRAAAASFQKLCDRKQSRVQRTRELRVVRQCKCSPSDFLFLCLRLLLPWLWLAEESSGSASSCTGLTEAPPSSGLNKQKQIRRSHHVSVKGAGHLLQSGPITRASDFRIRLRAASCDTNGSC